MSSWSSLAWCQLLYFHVDSCLIKRPSRDRDKIKNATMGCVSVSFGVTTSLSWMFGEKSLHLAYPLSKWRWGVKRVGFFVCFVLFCGVFFVAVLYLQRKKHIFFKIKHLFWESLFVLFFSHASIHNYRQAHSYQNNRSFFFFLGEPSFSPLTVNEARGNLTGLLEDDHKTVNIFFSS